MVNPDSTCLLSSEQATKRCTKCQTLKPLSDFHRQGKHAWCRTCVSQYHVTYQQTHPKETRGGGAIRVDITNQQFTELLVLRMFRRNGTTYVECQCTCGNICEKLAALVKNGSTKSCGCLRKKEKGLLILREDGIYKKCTECAKEKLLEEFHKDKNQRSGYSCSCKLCATTRTKQYVATHPEEASNAKKRWAIANRQQYLKNQRVAQARRRARKLGLPDTFTKEDEDFLLQYWHYTCAVCGAERGIYNDIVLDHWIPIASPACLGTIPGNIVPLCQATKNCPSDILACNNRKSSKDPVVWLVATYGERKAKVKLKAIETFFLAAKAFQERRTPCDAVS